LAGQPGLLEMLRRDAPHRRKRGGKASELLLLTLPAPFDMPGAVHVLTTTLGVEPDGLTARGAIPGDPDVGPGRRDSKSAQPLELLRIRYAVAKLVDEVKAPTLRTAAAKTAFDGWV